jgi:hypothetical protein
MPEAWPAKHEREWGRIQQHVELERPSDKGVDIIDVHWSHVPNPQVLDPLAALLFTTSLQQTVRQSAV